MIAGQKTFCVVVDVGGGGDYCNVFWFRFCFLAASHFSCVAGFFEGLTRADKRPGLTRSFAFKD